MGIRALAAACGPVALAASAFAQDHGAAGAHEPGPLLSFDPGTAITSIIVFVVLLLILRLFAWKPILAALQQRERFIEESIEGARREREEADKLLREYREQIDRAREEATAIVDEGKRDAETTRGRIHKEAQQEGKAMIERARREIQLAADDAVKRLYELTAETAVNIAGQVIRREVSADEHRQFVDESLERIKKSNEARFN